ncbi:MAG: hypothetical protein PUP93_02440 [Rhizonema sp. NSF051]|nr:hypothetical protein [Rhizonema sp. NSF051]
MSKRKFLFVALPSTLTGVTSVELIEPAQALQVVENHSTKSVDALQYVSSSGEQGFASGMIAIGCILALVSSVNVLSKALNLHHPSSKASHSQHTRTNKQFQAAEKYTTSDVKQNIPATFIEQAYTSYKLGDTQRAIAEFDHAILVNPQDAYVYTERANFRRNKLEDRLGALEDYTQAISIHPENPLLYVWRSQLYYEIGDKLKAMTDHNTAIRLAPEDTMYHFFPTHANAGRR